MMKNSSAGYTLIELLIVISITAILSLVGFANYKNFTQEQIVSKASADLQSMLRLVQSNASSSVLCTDNVNTSPWKISLNQLSLTLSCGPTNSIEKTYTFDKAQISSITGSSCGGSASSLPVTITFVNIVGNLVFESSGASATCLSSQTWVITVTNTQDSTKTKSFTLSRGGAVDAQ